MKKWLIKVRRLKKMDKYIIVTTFCNKEEIANNIEQKKVYLAK